MPLLPLNTARRRAAALVVLLATAAVAYVVLRPAPPAVDAPARVDSSGMTVQNIRQASTRDGRTEWVLEATSATYRTGEKKVLLKDMRVTFFRKEGGEIYLTARDGAVMTDSQDMEAHGDVVVWNEQYRMTTEELAYTHATRIITSGTRARITNAAGEIAGDRLRVDLNTNVAEMDGRVQGRIVSD
jgi:LPS export ABC transporter protein LptC